VASSCRLLRGEPTTDDVQVDLVEIATVDDERVEFVEAPLLGLTPDVQSELPRLVRDGEGGSVRACREGGRCLYPCSTSY
jgi:hypothetical protein